MRRIFWLLFCLLIGSGAAFGQFPANPNKIRLGNQTTGDGLVYRTDSIPDWTPSDVRSAWIAFDTVSGVLYYYEGGTWNSFTSGGAGIDSIAYASDTLYIYTPAETFKAEIIAGSAPNLTFTNALGPVKLSAGADSVAFDDGTGTNVTQSGGTLYYNLNSIGTPGTYTSVTTDAYGRVTAGTNPGFVTVVDSTRVLSDSIAVYYQNGSEIGRDTIRVPVSGGSGTVTSIAAGNGISVSPSPITTTGTVSADTTVLGSKTWTNNQLILKLNISDTAAMLAPYLLGSELLPTWTTAGRPAAPSAGRTGYNTTAGNLDFYGAAAWENPLRSATATGLGTANQIFFADANGRASGSTQLTWNGHVLRAIQNTTNSVFIAGGNTTATGVSNVAIGNEALLSVGIGNQNMAIGPGALRSLTTALDNVAIGGNAGRGITTGIRNFALGTEAIGQNALGSSTRNVAVGYASLNRIRGDYNVAIGDVTGFNVTSASNNVFIGALAGYNTTLADSLRGSNNILIGYAAGYPAGISQAASKNILIGANQGLPTANGSNQIVIGNLFFGTGASGTGTTIPAGSKAGIKTATPARDLEVAGEVRITDLTTDTPTQIVGADADGDLGAITVGSGLSLSAGTLTATGGVSDGDKGDIDVTSSGAVWTVDTNAVTTVKISDGAVTSDKLASGAAGGAKLGGLTYISADDVDVNLSSYLSIDWLTNYSQLVVWLRIGNTASRTVTFPTPSSTYQGKVVEIFFGATNGGTHFGQITAGGTNRITYRTGANVATATTYDGGQALKYMRIICAQDPNTLAYQWLVMDERN